MTIRARMLMCGKVSQESFVELTARPAMPNREICLLKTGSCDAILSQNNPKNRDLKRSFLLCYKLFFLIANVEH